MNPIDPSRRHFLGLAGLAATAAALAPRDATARATPDAHAAGTIRLGGDLPISRLGYGAMRITGQGIWGEPADARTCRAVLRRAIDLGVDFIDTANAYGPQVSERLIADQLQEHEPQLAAVEHPPAPAAAVVVAAPVTPAKAISETAAAPAHSMPHRLAHHPMHGMALAAAMPVHSMSHSKLLHAIRCI